MKEKLFPLFLLLQFLVFAKGKTHCGDEILSNACYATGLINEINETYVNPCKKGEHCPLYENFSVCYKEAKERNIGKKCKGHVDCFYGKCINGKCRLMDEGDDCDYDEQCPDKYICSTNLNKCVSMKSLGSPCYYTTDCIIGLECSGKSESTLTCNRMGSAENGMIGQTPAACQSGYGIVLENDEFVQCVTLKTNSSTCIQDESDGKYYCHGILEGDTNQIAENKLECLIDWNETYICPTEKYSSFSEYLEVFSAQLSLLKEENNNRLTERYSLDIKPLANLYVEYNKYEWVHNATSCIKNFYYQYFMSSNYIFPFSRILLTVLFIFYS